MNIFKTRILNLSDIDQGVHKHAIQKKEFFGKIIQRINKKNPTLVYPEPRYAHKK